MYCFVSDLWYLLSEKVVKKGVVTIYLWKGSAMDVYVYRPIYILLELRNKQLKNKPKLFSNWEGGNKVEGIRLDARCLQIYHVFIDF